MMLRMISYALLISTSVAYADVSPFTAVCLEGVNTRLTVSSSLAMLGFAYIGVPSLGVIDRRAVCVPYVHALDSSISLYDHSPTIKKYTYGCTTTYRITDPSPQHMLVGIRIRRL